MLDRKAKLMWRFLDKHLKKRTFSHRLFVELSLPTGYVIAFYAKNQKQYDSEEVSELCFDWEVFLEYNKLKGREFPKTSKQFTTIRSTFFNGLVRCRCIPTGKILKLEKRDYLTYGINPQKHYKYYVYKCDNEEHKPIWPAGNHDFENVPLNPIDENENSSKNFIMVQFGENKIPVEVVEMAMTPSPLPGTILEEAMEQLLEPEQLSTCPSPTDPVLEPQSGSLYSSGAEQQPPENILANWSLNQLTEARNELQKTLNSVVILDLIDAITQKINAIGQEPIDTDLENIITEFDPCAYQDTPVKGYAAQTSQLVESGGFTYNSTPLVSPTPMDVYKCHDAIWNFNPDDFFNKDIPVNPPNQLPTGSENVSLDNMEGFWDVENMNMSITRPA